MKVYMTIREALELGIWEDICKIKDRDPGLDPDPDEPVYVYLPPGMIVHWIRSQAGIVRDYQEIRDRADMIQGVHVICNCGSNRWKLRYFCPETDQKMKHKGSPTDLLATECTRCRNRLGYVVDPDCSGAKSVKNILER